MIKELRAHAIKIGRKNPCIDSFILYLLSLDSLTLKKLLDKFNIEVKSLMLITSLFLSNKKFDSLREERTVLKVLRESKKICKDTLGALSKKDLNLYSSSVEFLFLALLSLKEEEMPQALLFLIDEDETFLNSFKEELILFCLDKPSKRFNKEADTFVEEDSEHEVQDPFGPNRILEQFSENLNQKALNGEFDGFVDYDNLIDKLYVTLCRSKKPNAIITGESGVGKSAIVSILARNIVNGSAPEILRDKVIYSVNLSEMVAGTEYRGMFEKRLTNFIAEAKKKKNVILFFDEIHTLVGAGGGSRGNEDLEASNILKPALARGEISCIGATTPREYDLKIKNDPALERRFQRLNLYPPSSDTMKEILPHLLKYYGGLHKVKFSKDFEKNIIEFCNDKLPRKCYPDKLVDVIDFCGAKCKMDAFIMPKELKDIEAEIIDKVDSGPEELGKLLKTFGNSYSEWEKAEKKALVTKKYLNSFLKENSKCILTDSKIEILERNLKKKIINKSNVDKFIKFLSLSNFKKSRVNVVVLYGKKKSGKTFFLEEIEKEFRNLGKEVIELTSFSLSNLENLIGSQRSFAKKMMHHENPIIILDNIDALHPEAYNIMLDAFKTGYIESIDGDKVDISDAFFIVSCGVSSNNSVGFDKTSDVAPDIRGDLKEISEIILIDQDESNKNEFVKLKMDSVKKLLNKEKFKECETLMQRKFSNYGEINLEFNKVITPLLNKKTKKQNGSQKQ